MARMLKWFGLAAFGFSLTGCVAQDKYNALKLERDRYAEQLTAAQTEASTAKAEADVLRQQVNAMAQGGQGRDGLIQNLTSQNAELQKQIEEMNRKYAEALNRPVGGGSALPAPLTNELQAFANQNPDLVDFDAARGIVKFKSDLTFNLGSAEVTSKAKSVIDRFASILNSPAASGYELMVAGHTDSNRVSNPETIKAGHKDNWFLSAHRAIAVGSELQHHGVGSQRLGVVGYADQRPIASNATTSGQAQNRRVEVLILPNTVRASSGVASSSSHKATPKQTRSAPRNNMNKDAVAAPDNRPVFNK
jgi:chemotaxis protein MotB